MGEKVTLRAEGVWEMDIGDIWPDGDAPKHPTAADVVRVMEADCESAKKLIRKWLLDEPMSMTATLRGETARAWE